MQPLKLLISAYACEPGKGSEPGVGWRWALETAALGHEVWVITRENNATGIEMALTQQHWPKNLHFIYYDLPIWARWWKKGGYGVHLYYLLWQWGAYSRARELQQAQLFDAVHHITFGVTRHPSFMGRLGIPLIVGPLGGGERAPIPLRKYYPWYGRFKDNLRDVVNALSLFDPWLQQMYTSAALILLKTPQSLDWLPARFHYKAQCMLEIGVDQPVVSDWLVLPSKSHQALRILYVGRFLYFKGMDIGLRAIAELRKRGIAVRLTMIGQGPEKRRWQALTARLKLADCVSWVPWMKQPDLLQAYQTFDLLLFASLHDSSGNVVLEAMAGGIPVVCLDLGGPAQLVDASCGRVIGVEGQSAQQVVSSLADALDQLANDPSLMSQLREGAFARSQEFAWRNVVAQVWGEHGAGYQTVLQGSKKEATYASA